MHYKEIIEELEGTGQYKVIHKYKQQKFYHRDDGSIKSKGMFLDVETTGLNYEKDKIIEIALVPFEFSKDGRIFNIKDDYSCFNDPGIPLSKKIVSLTGLTDEMLIGKSFDISSINNIVESVDLIIAHNASFDRKFVEKIFPIFKTKAWACSANQVSWENENIASKKLEYLAYKFGFYFDGHRAAIDCYASLHLLSKRLPISGDLALNALLKNAREKSFRIWAIGSAFEKKDELKNRGYRWWPGGQLKKRSWYIDVDENNMEFELNFLKEEIYKKSIDLPIDVITPFNRFSDRLGVV